LSNSGKVKKIKLALFKLIEQKTGKGRVELAARASF
jgi:hypothetical protein